MVVKHFLKNCKGQILVLFAICLPVLLGFAALSVDVSYLYLQQAELQTAADNGALTGCMKLNMASPSITDAQSRAEAIAKTQPGKATDTTVVTVNYLTTGNTSSVQVTTSRTVKLFFAPILGIANPIINANATAQVTAATGIPPGAPPFVIQAPKANSIAWQGGPRGDSYSQTYSMKINPTAATDFTYVDAVFAPNTSNGDYLKLLQNGYQQAINLDTTLYYLSQAAGGQTAVDSFASRLTQPGNTDILQARTGDPRLMLIPVVKTLPSASTRVNSTKNLTIIGFIGFWFDSISYGSYNPWNGTYPNFVVTGRFVRVPLPASSGAVDLGQQWYGTGSVILVK